jgi:hypothetical protein
MIFSPIGRLTYDDLLDLEPKHIFRFVVGTSITYRHFMAKNNISFMLICIAYSLGFVFCALFNPFFSLLECKKLYQDEGKICLQWLFFKLDFQTAQKFKLRG